MMRQTYAGLVVVSLAAPAAGAAIQAQTGSIVGTVKTLSVPNSPPLEVTKNRDYCGATVPFEAVVATPSGRLRYAVVYVEGAESPGALERTALKITNEKCAFVPHVQAGMVRSRLEITSADPILHNTHLFLLSGSRTKSLINLALPGEDARLDASRATRRPGVVQLKCDAHKWMSGYLLLFSHPYYAVTDREGSFSIHDLPPGTYTIKVWHETFGELAQQVVVEPGKAVSLSFEFAGQHR